MAPKAKQLQPYNKPSGFAHAKILTNPDEFRQSDSKLEKAMRAVQNLSKRRFWSIGRKSEIFSSTSQRDCCSAKIRPVDGYQLFARRQQWQKELFNISRKYPESLEAIKVLEMIGQIKGTDSIKKDNVIYLNYKWIFTFKVKDTASLRKKKWTPRCFGGNPDSRWFLSEDRFDQNQTYLVCMEFAWEESSMSGKRGLMGPSKNSHVQFRSFIGWLQKNVFGQNTITNENNEINGHYSRIESSTNVKGEIFWGRFQNWRNPRRINQTKGKVVGKDGSVKEQQLLQCWCWRKNQR